MAIMPMIFCACSSFIEDNNSSIIPVTPDLQAGFADETRTYVENNKYLRWHENDCLTAFYGNTLNRQYKFNGKTGDNSGTFSLVPSGELGTGNAFDRIYAVYPYNETATITDEGEISLTLPAIQSYAENSFGKGANTMIAVTENLEDSFLAFKNACGYLKLKLYNADGATIKSIEVNGNNNEKIAGVATATIAFGKVPQLTIADNATTTVTLDCGEGITLGTTTETATEFWVVLPETTFEGGITIKATNTEGGVFEKTTENKVVITRNEILPMAAVEFLYKNTMPANNEIWYTTIDGNIVEPYNKDAFGASIISNTYENGKGVIIFDREVVKLGSSAFYNCTSLSSITIPSSITTMGYNVFSYCTGELIINSKIIETDYKKMTDNSTPTNNSGWLYKAQFDKITIGSNVTKIGNYAFYNCKSLISVVIPDSITSIGNGAFYSCKSLMSITIPNSVTNIGNNAFGYCDSLTNVTIPNSVTEIGSYAFSSCSSLKSVTILDNIMSIGTQAFSVCDNLQEIHCMCSFPPSLGEHVLCYYDTTGLGSYKVLKNLKSIYVPYKSFNAYKVAYGWKDYANYIVGYDF